MLLQAVDKAVRVDFDSRSVGGQSDGKFEVSVEHNAAFGCRSVVHTIADRLPKRVKSCLGVRQVWEHRSHTFPEAFTRIPVIFPLAALVPGYHLEVAEEDAKRRKTRVAIMSQNAIRNV